MPFYSDNEHRSYPLVDGQIGLPVPNDAIVDFGAVMGNRSGFVSGRDAVWLYRVSRSGSTFTFEFRTDASALSGRGLIFDRDLADPEYTCSFSSAEAVSATSEDGEDSDPLMEGFLVTGRMSTLAGVLADGEEWVDHDADQTVEPALLQNLANTAVRNVNLANADRTRVPDGCPGSSASSSDSVSDDSLIVRARGLDGPLVLKEGYNCSIRLSRQDNSLTLSAAVGSGEGEPCAEVPLWPEEAAVGLLSGGPSCADVLKSVSGVGGRVVRIVGGDGIAVYPGVDTNTLVIEADLHGMALCAPAVTSSVGG